MSNLSLLTRVKITFHRATGALRWNEMDNLKNTFLSPQRRKPLGDLNGSNPDVGLPVSPTANLKLLTKVASQCDFVEKSSSNVGFGHAVRLNDTLTDSKLENEINVTPNESNTNEFDAYSSEYDHEQPYCVKYVRKFKSLGFLCDKFLKIFPLDIQKGTQLRISLTHVADQLGVEKRRIYDIVNVVESLQMAVKIGKNMYAWFGNQNLADSFAHLKAHALQLGLDRYVLNEQIDRHLYSDDKFVNIVPEFKRPEDTVAGMFVRNERRIGVLCQKFVMLFLVSNEHGLINLDLAASILVGTDGAQHNKTRLRRLYDIANILLSLGIIKKKNSLKKPVFVYNGPPVPDTYVTSAFQDSPIFRRWTSYDSSDMQNSDASVSEDSIEILTENSPFKTTDLIDLGYENPEFIDLTSDNETSNLTAAETVKLYHSYSRENSPKSSRNVSFQTAFRKRLFPMSSNNNSNKVCETLMKAPLSPAFSINRSETVIKETNEMLKKRNISPVNKDEENLVKKKKNTSIVHLVTNRGTNSHPVFQDGGLYKAVHVDNVIKLIQIGKDNKY